MIPKLLFPFPALASSMVLVSCDVGKTSEQRENPDSSEGAIPAVHGSPHVTLAPLEPASRRTSKKAPLFETLSAAKTGIDHVYELDLQHPLKRLYSSAWACSGVMAGDFNNDRKVDLFFTSAAGPNLLYLNEGGWKFREVAATSGVTGGEGFAAGAAVADIEGDGDLDIYVCNYDFPNQLFLNTGNGPDGIPRFQESALPAGLDAKDSCVTASFCDYDKDGDLDLFILTNRLYQAGGVPEDGATEIVDGKLRIKAHLQQYYGFDVINGKSTPITIGRKDLLFRNDTGPDRQPKFTNVSESAGMTHLGYGLSATWWDYNEDGWPDLYIANDYRYPDRLLHNNQDGTFTDRAPEVVPYTPFFSMGSASGDFTNDGRSDLIALDMAATTHYKAKVSMGALTPVNRHVLDHSVPQQYMRNTLFINSGMGRVAESAFQSHLASSDWSWTPLLGDYDCDGLLDVVITNGMVRDFTNADAFANIKVEEGKSLFSGRDEWDLHEKGDPNPERNMAFRNKGQGAFEDVSKTWGIDRNSVSFGACWADFDDDGDLDFISTCLGEPPLFYRNHSDKERIIIALKDPHTSNVHGIGARLTIETDLGIQTHTIQPANGFLNANQPVAQFGLGDRKRIKALAIEWPGGPDNYQILQDLPSGHHITVTRDLKAPAKPPEPAFRPLFKETGPVLGNFKHQEYFHDDFLQQNLLPSKQSEQGPGHAWGDVNGDGLDDLFITSGAVYQDYLFMRKPNRFTAQFSPFGSHSEGESVAPLFFDADGDNDPDLYLTRGSYEFPEGSPLHQDHLYLNDGNGNFTLAPSGAIPSSRTVSGTVSASSSSTPTGSGKPGTSPPAPAISHKTPPNSTTPPRRATRLRPSL